MSDDYKARNIKESKIELRKQVRIDKNREVRFERNWKRFNFDWKNDKRIILLNSEDTHIKTMPVCRDGLVHCSHTLGLHTHSTLGGLSIWSGWKQGNDRI